MAEEPTWTSQPPTTSVAAMNFFVPPFLAVFVVSVRGTNRPLLSPAAPLAPLPPALLSPPSLFLLPPQAARNAAAAAEPPVATMARLRLRRLFIMFDQ